MIFGLSKKFRLYKADLETYDRKQTQVISLFFSHISLDSGS